MAAACEIADQWLYGAALPAGYPSTVTIPGDSPVDIAGNALSVGMLVKLVGTIVAINSLDPHFQDITIAAQFPQSKLVSPATGLSPQNVPAPNKQFQFHPLMLLKVGSSY